MTQEIDQPIELRSGDAGQPGHLKVLAFDNRERMNRALKLGGIFWGLAAVSVMIPIAHWVLVPGLLLAGPLAAWFKYRQQYETVSAQGVCPLCDTPVVIPMEAADRLPKWVYCPKCNGSLHLLERAS